MRGCFISVLLSFAVISCVVRAQTATPCSQRTACGTGCRQMEGVCRSTNCPASTTRADCENNGCSWSSSGCDNAFDCEDLSPSSTACLAFQNCDFQSNVCITKCSYYADETACHNHACAYNAGSCQRVCETYATQASCAAFSCSWSSQSQLCSSPAPTPAPAATPAATPGGSTAAPAGTTTPIAGATGAVTPPPPTTTVGGGGGGTTRAPAPPTPAPTATSTASACLAATSSSACYATSNDCYWDIGSRACNTAGQIPLGDANTQGPVVLGVIVSPERPNANAPFTFVHFGTALNIDNTLVYFTASPSDCTPDPPESTIFYAYTTANVNRRRYEGSATLAPGTWRFCVVNGAGIAQSVPDVAVIVVALAATVGSFSVSGGTAYGASAFRLQFTGSNLFGTDLVGVLPGTGDCPAKTNPRYVTVQQASYDARTSSVTLTRDAGIHIVCYASRDVGGALRVGTLSVVEPPFLDPSRLGAVVATLPPIPVLDGSTQATVAEFNQRYCFLSSGNSTRPAVVNGNGLPSSFFAGPYIHPSVFRFTFGDLYHAYAPEQRCVFAIHPEADAYATSTTTVRVEMEFVAFDTTDDVRLFVAQGHGLTLCSAFAVSACPQRCAVVDGRCTTRHNAGLSNCPLTIAGYDFIGTMTYAAFQAGHKEFSVPHPSGMMIVVCTDASIGAGAGLAVSYTVDTSRCPNDCMDDEGFSRGQCGLAGDSYKCLCDEGYFGDACEQSVTCSGANANAEYVEAESGSRSVTLTGTSTCGFSFTVVPSTDAERMAVYGAAIEFVEASLSSNCSESSVLIRSGSYLGATVKTLCADDLNGQTRRFLVPDATAYVELKGVADDAITINYATISRVCPGPASDTGVPATADECDGRGACVDVDLEAQTLLPTYSKRCRCRAPFASRSAYGSCDSCAFGFRQDNFPACPDVVRCASDAECNGGTCNALQRCQCPSTRYGSHCQSVVGSATIIAKEEALLRLPFDGVAANAVRAGTTDSTITQCQLPGAPYPCSTEARSVGKQLRDSSIAASDSNSSTAASRRQTVSNVAASLAVDVGMKLNELVVDREYRDFVRLTNATSEGLDVTMPFTVVAWVKMTTATNGFLAAKLDSAFYPNGETPVLQRALFDIRSRATPVEQLRLGSDSLALYWGIYMNGAQQRVDMITTTGSKQAERDDWHAVRHFRLAGRGSQLFDGRWHFVAVTVREQSGRIEAQMYIDAVSKDGSVDYTQCLPFQPSKFQLFANSSDPDLVVHEGGGTIHAGYHFQGAIDELRIYRTALTHQQIVRIGGSLFDGELAVPTMLLYVMFGVCCLVVAMCIGLCSFELIKRCNRPPPAEEDAPSSLDGNGGIYLVKDVDELDGSPLKTPAGFSPTEGGSAPQDDVSFAKVEPFEAPLPSDDDERGVVHAAVHRAAASVATQLADAASQVKKSRVDDAAAAAGAVAEAAQVTNLVASAATGQGIGGQASGGGATTTTSGDVVIRLVIGLANSVLSSKEFLLRFNLFFSCWQVVALWFIGFDVPPEYEEMFGRVAQVLSLELIEVTIPVDFLFLYYGKIILAALAFLILLAMFVSGSVKSHEQLVEEKQQEWARKQEAEAQGQEYTPRISKIQVIAFVCLFVVTSMYLPITRDAVVVVFCHSSVQCIFDCYNETKHNTAVIWGVISMIIFTLFLPIAVVFIIRRKKKEFDTLLGEDFVQSCELFEKETLWSQFVKTDISPYRSIYSGFEYNWIYFQAILMCIKAVVCFATLALDRNSTEQLAAIIVVQSVFSVATFYAAPFILDVCDMIMGVSQIYVMVILALATLYRANGELPMGLTMNIVSGATLVAQAIPLFWPKAS